MKSDVATGLWLFAKDLFFTCFVFSFDVRDVAHHNVDEGVLDQAQEDEDGARGHEDVDGLQWEQDEI